MSGGGGERFCYTKKYYSATAAAADRLLNGEEVIWWVQLTLTLSLMLLSLLLRLPLPKSDGRHLPRTSAFAAASFQVLNFLGRKKFFAFNFFHVHCSSIENIL